MTLQTDRLILTSDHLQISAQVHYIPRVLTESPEKMSNFPNPEQGRIQRRPGEPVPSPFTEFFWMSDT